MKCIKCIVINIGHLAIRYNMYYIIRIDLKELILIADLLDR